MNWIFIVLRFSTFFIVLFSFSLFLYRSLIFDLNLYPSHRSLLRFVSSGDEKKYFSVAERPAADNILVGIATCLFVQRADKFAIFLVESLCVRPQQIGIKIMETP